MQYSTCTCMYAVQYMYVCSTIHVCIQYSTCMYAVQCMYVCSTVHVHMYVCNTVHTCMYAIQYIHVYTCTFITYMYMYALHITCKVPSLPSPSCFNRCTVHGCTCTQYTYAWGTCGERLTHYHCSARLEAQAQYSAHNGWGSPLQKKLDYLRTIGGYETGALKNLNACKIQLK